MPKIIRITSTVDGFRRAGLSHPARAVDHPAEDITDKQLAAFKAEPKLIVQELDLLDVPGEPLTLEGAEGDAKDAKAGKAKSAEASGK